MSEDERRQVRTFLSWASKDRSLKEDLLDRMMPHLDISALVDIRWWDMSHLIPGDEWDSTICGRVADCDLGVHLVSPAFLASPYIAAHELGPFYGPDASKPTAPVGLLRVDLDRKRFRLHGVDERQVFLMGGKFYSEVTTRQRRDEFARLAADTIVARMTPRPAWGRR